MQKNRLARKAQSGFTIIELIVVIVILGILAAVAIPKFSSSASDARASVESATLGGLKSAWAAAYGVNKGAPTLAQLLAQMSDPICTVTTSPDFTCAGVFQQAAGSTLAVFTVTLNGTVIDSPANISIKTQ